MAVLVIGLSACSPSNTATDRVQAPGSTGTTDAAPDSPAGSSPGSIRPPSPAASGGAADLPAPAGVLPAPAQREPGPAVSGPGTAEGPTAPPPATDLHSDPGSVDVVVNKRRPLEPLDYAPSDLRRPDVATATDNALLRPDTAAAVEEMFAAAAGDGVGLVIVSGYRSFANQESTYAYWVGEYGDAAGADTVSARPGFSEHQTGLAFDIGQADGACTLVLCFRDTPAAQWAAAHAAEFGFVLRYPAGFHEITGFSAESWHFRFVGKDVSLAMESAGTQTLEEHFGLPAAPSY
ncbi:D-alanyl-D-alanine carboxypeptidase family protein [Arthrobacter sp. NamB2]|uniref:M15 family metallopeptidase n=1 Tax=Arthrobacter sp. NamB2 TaxID=2576035 RepID=UPI0010C9B80D|nr:M15 family metallopeptidase [Arthrobacter sp. NamB2]TKV29525.1 D-alanyl-D-alanine carboxypeptidase family protein [Arthrobacter sp. NamB2]